MWMTSCWTGCSIWEKENSQDDLGPGPGQLQEWSSLWWRWKARCRGITVSYWTCPDTGWTHVVPLVSPADCKHPKGRDWFWVMGLHHPLEPRQGASSESVSCMTDVWLEMFKSWDTGSDVPLLPQPKQHRKHWNQRMCFVSLPAHLWLARASFHSLCCCKDHSLLCSCWNLFLSWKFKSSPMNLCIPDTVFRTSLSDCRAGRSFHRARGSERSNSRRVSGLWKLCWKSLMAWQRFFLSLLFRFSKMHEVLSLCLISAATRGRGCP